MLTGSQRLNGWLDVDKLLFIVKLAPCVLLVLGAAACGYRPAYGGPVPGARLSIGALDSKVPDGDAAAAVLTALEGELAAAGALASVRAHPLVHVEVLRVEEGARGIRAEGGPLGLGESTVVVAVTARAWVVETPGAPPTWDTGDVRRTETAAASTEGATHRESVAAAARVAARKVGVALARRLLGEPEPRWEPL